MFRNNGYIKIISSIAIGVLIGTVLNNREVSQYAEINRDLQAGQAAKPQSVGNKRVEIFKKVAPSVVFIDVFEKASGELPNSDAVIPKGSGSGFIWDNEGHIITNNHIVQGASVVEVSLLSKKKTEAEDELTSKKLYLTSHFGRGPSVVGYHWKVVKAKVVGSDPATDCAVIKVDTSEVDVHPVAIGNLNNVNVGADVLAIGNPFGLDHTLTQGIISAKNRVHESIVGIPITGVLQTDAAINPGNSGGPLLDSSGKVIGMNTAILSESGSSSGIGFSVNIATIKTVSKLLINRGKVERPFTGIMFSEQIQSLLGIKEGVLIRQVLPDSPAKWVGLKGTEILPDGSIALGDIILSINDVKIHSDLEFFETIEDHDIWENVELEIIRLDEEKGVQMKKITLKIGVTNEKQNQNAGKKNFDKQKTELKKDDSASD